MTVALILTLIVAALFAPETPWRHQSSLAIAWEASRGLIVLFGLPVLGAAVFGLVAGR